MKIINTNKAPTAIGPYVQAIENNNTLYISGQIPLVPGKIPTIEAKDIKGQTQQSLNNLKAIVEEAGYKINNIVKCNVYLSDLNNFAACNEIYEKFFQGHKPARVCIEVSKLPKGSLVEIDAIAVK